MKRMNNNYHAPDFVREFTDVDIDGLNMLNLVL